jgi:aspartyl-tRNA(Asn)/glutamyl-tRNA(Gln) amidotransferase subunit B
MDDFCLKPAQIAEIIELIESNKISHTAATQQLFPAMTQNADASAESLVGTLGLANITDTSFIDGLVQTVLAEFPDKVTEYRAGKVGLLGLFVGEVMKRSKGKADPKTANALVKAALEQD